MMEDQQKIREVKRKYEQEWLSIEGVVGVGIGILADKNLGIMISVTKLNELISKKIPAEVEGIKLEIRETGEFKAL
jgi:hypothetical protein